MCKTTCIYFSKKAFIFKRLCIKILLHFFFVSSSFWYCFFLSLKMKKDHCSSEDSSYVVVVTVARIFQILSKNYETLECHLNLQKYYSNNVSRPFNPQMYIFYSLFKVKKIFLRGFFCKILALCTFSIQERFLIKSGL